MLCQCKTCSNLIVDTNLQHFKNMKFCLQKGLYITKVNKIRLCKYYCEDPYDFIEDDSTHNGFIVIDLKAFKDNQEKSCKELKEKLNIKGDPEKND